METHNIYSVSEIASQLTELFNAPLFSNLTIIGEVTSKNTRKGTNYVALSEVDDYGKVKASLNVVVFASVETYSSPYNVGDKIMVTGRFNYYEPSGSLSFLARKIAPYGQGNEMARIRALYEKLKNLGVFDESKKRPLPKYPRKIAIITSGEGAAYRDILDTLKSRFPVSTVLYDAKVQGSDGPREICRALELAYNDKSVDVIILGRGGGSKADLMPFNDEKVVLKVSESPVPLITAIGHEIDTSLADYASDYKAITPTAAASAASPSLSETVALFDDYEKRLNDSLLAKLENKEYALTSREMKMMSLSPVTKLNKMSNELLTKENDLYLSTKVKFETLEHKLNEASRRLGEIAPGPKIALKGQQLESKKATLESVITSKLNNYTTYLTHVQERLNLLDPYAILKKGYAAVSKGDKTITSVKGIKENDTLNIRLSDGMIVALTKEVKEDE